MIHAFLKPGPWFAAKRFGYGASLPIAWQGWALIAGYLAILAGLRELIHLGTADADAAAGVLFVTVTCLVLAIVARRTEGGWRWRWGSRDNNES